MPPVRILKTIDFLQRKQDGESEYIAGLWSDFGKSVRECRKKKRIGLKEFAADMSVSRAMCSYLESGKRQWNFEMARKAVWLLNK